MAEGLWKDLALPGGEVRSDGLSVPNAEGRAWPSPPPGHDAGTWARAARASWTFETNTIVNFCDYFIFQSLKYVLVLSIVAFKYNS